MEENGVTSRDLADEVLGERFPDHRGVTREATSARSRMRPTTRLDPTNGHLVDATFLPYSHADTRADRDRRRADLVEAMPGNYGHTGHRKKPTDPASRKTTGT